MRRYLLAATMLSCATAQAQTVNLNLSAVNSASGFMSDNTSTWSTHYVWGGSESKLTATDEVQNWSPSAITQNPAGGVTLTASDNNGNITSGTLVSATETNGTGANPSYGMPQAGGFTFTYGYFAIAVQGGMPSDPGTWAAFWSMPLQAGVACEIDVDEAVFNDPSKADGSLHDGGTGYSTNEVPVPNFNPNGTNIYGVDWEPNTITWYYNGVQVGQVATPASCHTPHYLISNLAIGGSSSWPAGYAPYAGETVQMNIQSITYNPSGFNGGGSGTYSGALASAPAATPTTAASPVTTSAAVAPPPTATSAPTGAVGSCGATASSAASVPLFGPGSGPTVTATPASLQGILSSATPGETIQLGSGTYSPFTVSNSGTQGQPITIQAAPGATPIVAAGTSAWAGVQISANWVTVQGLSIQGQAQNMSLAAAQSAGLGGSTYNTNGIQVGTVGAAPVAHVQILNDKITNMPGGGIVGVYADYLTFMGNNVTGSAHFSHYAASAISLGFSKDVDSNTGTKNYIVGNIANNNAELVNNIVNGPGLGITDGSGIIVDDNSNDQNNNVPYDGGTLVSDNQTNNNGGSGVRVYSSNNVSVNNNAASGNGAGDIDIEGGANNSQSGNSSEPGCQTVSAAATVPTPAFASALPPASVSPAPLAMTTSTPAEAPSAVSVAPPAAATPVATSAALLPPVEVQSCAATPTGAGGFHVAGGQIIGPNGQPWVARGINLYGPMAGSTNNGAMLTQTFTGLNFVRYIARPLLDPSTYDAFASAMTAQGIVVEFEDHPDGGGGVDAPYTGAQLATESAWYAGMAAHFASNPYVWFGTFNEPGIGQPGQLSAWQKATYKAVRSASNAILMVEDSDVVSALVPSVYAGMTNIVWDQHFYPNRDSYSGDPTAIANAINATIANDQTITSADGVVPVIIGESGPSTSGLGLDTNGYATVTGLINAAQTATMGGLAPFTWYPGFSSPNNLTDESGNPTAPYGQMVKLYINTDTVPLSACQTTQRGQQTLATAQATLQAQPPAAQSAAPVEAAPSAPASLATSAMEADAQQQVDAIQAQTPAIDTAIAATQAKIQAALAAQAPQ